jgi:hypothetical protein
VKEPPRKYASAAAFRVALETRLKAISTTEGIDLQRLRRQVSFDRLLARFFAEKNAPWLLKGGYAMELRLRTARTTKDIDISLPAEMVDAFDGGVVKRVQQSAPNRIGRFFYFRYWRVAIGFECCPTRWNTLSGRYLNRGPGLHQVPSGRRDRRRRRASDGVDKGKKLARLCRHPAGYAYGNFERTAIR